MKGLLLIVRICYTIYRHQFPACFLHFEKQVSLSPIRIPVVGFITLHGRRYLKIYVDSKSITIDDEKKSTYTLISEAPGIREVEASVESWNALDMNGKPCYVTLTTYKNGPVKTRVSFFYNIKEKRIIYYNVTEAH